MKKTKAVSRFMKESGYVANKAVKLYCPDCKKITSFIKWLDSPGGYLRGVVCGNCDSNRQQKEPSYYDMYPYQKKCKCGKKYTVLTQDDNYPEYHTEVNLVCECGNLVEFILPVN